MWAAGPLFPNEQAVQAVQARVHRGQVRVTHDEQGVQHGQQLPGAVTLAAVVASVVPLP